MQLYEPKREVVGRKGIRLRHATRLAQSIPGFWRVVCAVGYFEGGDGEDDDSPGGDCGAHGGGGGAWLLGRGR